MEKRSINPLANLYNQNNIHDRRQRRDLNLFTYAAALGAVFFTVTGGTAFTGFTSALGASDLQYSILFAVPATAAFIQLFVSWILEKTKKRKFIFILSGLVQRSTWIPVALVPLFVPMDRPLLRLWVVVALLSLSSVASMFMNVTFYSWLGDVIPINLRGRYLSLRYSIFTSTGLVSAVIASILLDHMPGLTGYMVVFGAISLFGIADIVCFLWIREPPMMVIAHEPFLKSLTGVFRDRDFIVYLLFWTAWLFAWNLPNPFYNKYAIDKLHINLTLTTLAGQVAYGVTSVLIAHWWGRRLDAHGHHWVLVRCCFVLCLLPLVWLFASPGVIWPMLIASLGAGIFFSGTDLTSVQMLMSATPARGRSMFLATYMVITSLVGVSLANYIGGALLSFLGEVRFTVLGLEMDRYKLLFAGACALRLLLVLLLLPRLARIRQRDIPETTMPTERMNEHGCENLT